MNCVSILPSRSPNPSISPLCAKNVTRPSTSRRNGWEYCSWIVSFFDAYRRWATSRRGGLQMRASRRTNSSYRGSAVALPGPRTYNSPSAPIHAIPQPSGWPAFGFGCGHPKSRKFRPVSASWRNARSVSTGAGLRLTIPSMRHMSAQLVPDLPEERDPILPFLRSLHALRPLAVHDAEDAPSAGGLGHDDVHGIRGGRE